MFNQSNSQVLCAKALNSVLVLLLATVVYFLLLHVTKLSHTKVQYLIVDLLFILVPFQCFFYEPFKVFIVLLALDMWISLGDVPGNRKKFLIMMTVDLNSCFLMNTTPWFREEMRSLFILLACLSYVFKNLYPIHYLSLILPNLNL